MKKILISILVIIFLCFFIPTFFTKKFESKEVATENITETSSVSDYNYKEFDEISVLHKKTNEIEKMKLDEYLYGVVSAEMPVDYEMEALKAQAIVARTYTMYKLLKNPNKHGQASICDDSTCCQAWISKEERMSRWEENKKEENWNKIVQAVNSTAGKIITYNNEPINAFFHSNSGGKTEIPINVWGGSNYPYLQSVETAGEEGYLQYASNVEFTKQEIIDRLKEKYKNISLDFNKTEEIKIIEYTESGRVKTLKVGNVNLSGVEARQIFGLKSTNFQIEIVNEKVKFNVTGYGHGVGLSQTGSESLAKEGKSYEEIIKHFYTGVEITNY